MLVPFFPLMVGLRTLSAMIFKSCEVLVGIPKLHDFFYQDRLGIVGRFEERAPAGVCVERSHVVVRLERPRV